MPVNKIIIRGEKLRPATLNGTDDYIQLSETYNVGIASRGAGESHAIELKDDNLVEFVFDDGTTWLSNANTIEEVFPEAAQKRRSVDGAFEVPLTLRGAATERGVADILLKAINIFGKKKIQKEVNAVVHTIAADLEKKQLENFSGLYRVEDGFGLVNYEAQNSIQPHLLFLHGTASSTKGSFDELGHAKTPGQKTAWEELRAIYNNNILAFQHETLTKTPLQNAVELADQLPSSITLHLVSHSRGGLVGDVLSRFCNSNENSRGFDEAEIAYLKKTERDDDLKNIDKLKSILQQKKITIEKFVRVACPANGTILASKRIDNFLNILLNLVSLSAGIAATPVYTLFKSLVAAVIDAKNSEDALPGIAAMNPESPFIKVLNSPGTTVEINNPLVVISGNCKIGLQLKALVVIASKLFYFTDNDLVVNTRSMYQGSKRHDSLKYLFDEATDVDHFHYFANEKTSKALLTALRADGNLLPAGFKTELQQKLAERNAILKAEGGEVFTNTVTGTKPIVVLLPGIMGSNLSVNNKLVWINYWDFITGGLSKLDLGKREKIEAPSLVGTSYRKLVSYLSATYDVVTFPFDWRLSLTDCAKTFNGKIVELLKYGQPIKIIGHSMGGVLVREFIINHDDTWKKLNQTAGFRLLFLGAPLGGSFRIPAVLFGKDGIIDKLSRIDIFHTKKELLEYFSKMPGLWSLLPLTVDADNDFVKGDVWQKMAAAMNMDDWPLPVKEGEGELKWFKAYRDNILQKLESINYANAVYIAGRDKATPCGYRIDETPNGKELVFFSTAEGDQSVTWDSGIPKKMIDNGSVYYVNVTHGALANEPSIFNGISDILAKGSTTLLSTNRPAVRGEEKLFRSPEHFDFDLSERGVETTLLGMESQGSITEPEKPLLVSVSNGDLKHASYPVLVGHFDRDAILNAEAQVDKMLGGELSRKHLVGIYPGEAGTSEVILAEGESMKGGIVVGLGQFGTLTAYQLTKTVEQGICRYLLDVNRAFSLKSGTARSGQPLGVSSLIIGSGYGGLSIEDSVLSVLQGVQNANTKIEKMQSGGVSLVEQVEFVELYEDRALSCFYSVSRLEKDESRSLKVALAKKEIRFLFGSKRRIATETSESWWRRVTIRLDESYQSKDRRKLWYNLSTGGAREESKELYINPASIENIVSESSIDNLWSPRLAKTLFEKLLPIEFKEQIKRQFNINWVLDNYTASFPWELLQDNVDDARPLCVNTGMIRQLATGDYRLNSSTVADFTALVVGEPVLVGASLLALPGANEEGKKVAALLKDRQFFVTQLLNEDGTATARNINEALAIGSYKIIHLAGHGLFNKETPEHSGMVIGKDEYLTSADFKNMSTVPELVFVNCCHLGRTDPEAEEFYRNAYKMAANIGTQLILNGVKAVVVAGWAVSDAAALKFTETFYRNMFEGDCFGDAIRKGRKAVYEEFKNISNTWGAYQCYGDPYYKFRNNAGGNKPFSKEFVIVEEAEIELFNLGNELRSGVYTKDELRARLLAISAEVDKAGIRQASITEREALIYAALSEYGAAIEKFRSLLTLEKADFSVLSLERYCNIRLKKCVEDYFKAEKESASGPKKEQEARLTKQKRMLLKEAGEAIQGLDNLLQISPTAERYNLLGSAYKRKGFLSISPADKRNAYEKAAQYYAMANRLMVNNKAYGLTNWFSLEGILTLVDGKKRWEKVGMNGSGKLYDVPSKQEALAQLRLLKKTSSADESNMDYWLLIQGPNCQLCELIIDDENNAQKDWENLTEDYRRIWSQGGAKGDKLAETEHLQLLSDALSLSKKPIAKTMKKRIDQLRTELEKML